jgi:hypothetical protein
MQKAQQAASTASLEGLFAKKLGLQGAQLSRPVMQGVVGRRKAQEERLDESVQRKLLGPTPEKAGGSSQ